MAFLGAAMGHSSLSTPQTLGLRRGTVGLACIALAMGAMGVGNALAGKQTAIRTDRFDWW